MPLKKRLSPTLPETLLLAALGTIGACGGDTQGSGTPPPSSAASQSSDATASLSSSTPSSASAHSSSGASVSSRSSRSSQSSAASTVVSSSSLSESSISSHASSEPQSSSSSSAAPNRRPNARAGSNQTVQEGETVSLNGTASTDPDGEIARYYWQRTSGPAVTLSAARTATASFVAPEVEQNTTLRFSLTVTDDRGASDRDWVVVSVKNNDPIQCEAQGDAHCYYSAPGASGVGTHADPGSIQSLIPQLSRGDYLYLLEGVYTQHYRVDNADVIINLEKYVNFTDPKPTPEQPVTIKGYPGDQVVIRGDLARECIHVDGISNLVLADFKVERCYNKGVRIGNDIPEKNITLRNIEFADIQYHSDSGFLYVHSYDNVLIENCTFHDYIPKAGSDQVGAYLKFYRATDVTVRHNEFYGDGSGIYYKHGETTTGSGGYTRIHDNLFRDLTGRGIDTNENRTEIYNNRFIDTGGVRVHREDGTSPPFTRNVEISYNTFVGGRLFLAQGSNDGSYMGAFGLGAKSASVHHNIFDNTEYRIWTYGSDAQFDEGIDLYSEQNCFYDGDGSYAINYFAADGVWGDKGDNYALADWQALGYDTNSLEREPLLNADGIQHTSSPCTGIGYTP